MFNGDINLLEYLQLYRPAIRQQQNNQIGTGANFNDLEGLLGHFAVVMRYMSPDQIN